MLSAALRVSASSFFWRSCSAYNSRLEHMAQSVVTLVALWERLEEIVPHNPCRFSGDDWELGFPGTYTLGIYW